jgi:hypothetical protein
MQVMSNIESPFEAITAEILQRLAGTSNRKIVNLIFKQYHVKVIEKAEVSEGYKYSIHYKTSKDSKESHVWEFIHPSNN